MTEPDRRARILPLVLATMGSQALLVVLSPTIVAIAADLGASVGAIGQARSVTAAVATVASVAIAGRIDSIGMSRLLAVGASVALLGCAAIALAPSVATLLAAHILIGVAFACLLSAGFAGVAAFPVGRRAWALGYVAGANALAWIFVNPIVGIVTDLASWRAAQAVPAVICLGALALSTSAAPVTSAGAAPPLRAMLVHAPARRWLASELIAFGAWTGLLTFIGAYLVANLGVREAVVGWLLACGAAAYFFAAVRGGRILARFPRRPVVAITSLAMALFIAIQFNPALPLTVVVVLFCLIGVAAGVRTPVASALGLEQIPDQPAAMMAARTAVTQVGYLIGAVVGGILIAGPGYEMLGFAVAAGMAVSAVLIMRVDDPERDAPPAG